MDIRSVLKVAEIKLVKANFPSPALEAEILLSAVLGKNKEYLFSHPEEKVSIWQNFIFQRIINKRLAGYSSAVLVGHKWFYGLDFVVNKNVLVPRPETELMVDEVIKIIKSESLKIKNIVDVGTGSGCIIVSLAKNTRKIGVDLELYGLDISKKALKIARINAKKNNVDSCTHFLYSNLLNNIDKKIFNEPVLITANLPYLTSEQVKNSPTIQKEPRLALVSGFDGLDHYRRLFKQVKEGNGGQKNSVIILCEIDESQSAAARKLAEAFFPQVEIEIKKDLNGDDRLLTIALK